MGCFLVRQQGRYPCVLRKVNDGFLNAMPLRIVDKRRPHLCPRCAFDNNPDQLQDGQCRGISNVDCRKSIRQQKNKK